MTGTKVLKFGGTSMANADSIRQVAEIIKSDDNNKFVIVSAPGKRASTDTKVTDLLYGCYDEKQKTGNCDNALRIIKNRFDDIIEGLNIKFDMSPYFKKIGDDINNGADKDYVASRGEYLSALLMANYLEVDFIDASELIVFNKDGIFEAEKTNGICEKRLASSKRAIIPGFYGIMPDNKIKTFSRGGSDVSGSIVARAVKAVVYENWTDVDGFMTCDPRIVKNPHLITMLTYKELRELSYMGANVLHSDCIFPVRKNNIPINIRNTFNPSAKGTMIVPTKMFLSRQVDRDNKTITGIAGKKDFAAIYIEKSLMNNELGFAKKALAILEKYQISMEHMPSGIDTLTLVIEKHNIPHETMEKVIEEIDRECCPDNIELVENIALIAVVGHGMSRKPGTAYRLCGALYKANINIRMIDQGSSELNIIVGVENDDYEKAIQALYTEFESL